MTNVDITLLPLVKTKKELTEARINVNYSIHQLIFILLIETTGTQGFIPGIFRRMTLELIEKEENLCEETKI